LAPATAPPVASVTVPRTRPPVLCADARGALMQKTNVSKEERMQLQRIVRRDCFDFMNSPLSPEVLI
jgi:hypothetical protein